MIGKKLTAGAVFVVCTLLAVGCGQQPAGAGKDAGPKGSAKAEAGGKEGPKHDSWWCDEHGVPEAECSMCSDKVFKECKAKGDVCEKHPDRAKSQCFLCDPSLKEKFAVKYRAKYGKEPPEPEGQKEAKQ